MAQEVRSYAIVVSAGSTSATAVATDLDLPPILVRRVEFTVPPGPRGQVGFRLGSGGQTILPYGEDQWFIVDDFAFGFDLTNQIQSGAWQFIAYNTGNFDHTIYVRLLLDPVAVAANATAFLPLAL